MVMKKPCEKCQTEPAKKGERFCASCRKLHLEEMKQSYLTRAPVFAGQWSGISRTSEQRENTEETKHGKGHG
jgi:hypothetical protein